jgi:hypothetical protein
LITTNWNPHSSGTSSAQATSIGDMETSFTTA